jgi:RNA polymerase sigma-70 factor (ECF subfamily)
MVGELVDPGLLVERMAAGDRDAFHAFYRQYGARVMALVITRVAQRELAEELVQEVFVAAWLNARGYRRDLGHAEPWIMGIVRHKLLDHGRRMRRVAAAVGIAPDSVAQESPGPNADLRLSLERAVALLTSEQRRVVDLIYISGLTFTEAARALQIPAGTVKSRVNAALARMRTQLRGLMAS